MPWLTIRDRFGKTLEANPCESDCDARLLRAVQVRQAKNYTTTKIGPATWEAVSPSGDHEYLSLDSATPAFPES